MTRARLLSTTPAGAIAAFLPAVEEPGGARVTITVSDPPGHFVVGDMLAYGSGPPYERARILAIRSRPDGQVDLELEKEGGDALDQALGRALLRSGRLPLTTVVPAGRRVVRPGLQMGKGEMSLSRLEAGHEAMKRTAR